MIGLTDYRQFESLSAAELLSWAAATFGASFAILTSFQKEGLVIVDIAARCNPHVRVLTLDTGRMPEENQIVVDAIRHRYGIEVESIHPDPSEVQQMVSENGLDLFYESPENRRLCCEIRKVRPLQRKLVEFQAWASGLRREQSPERASIPKVEERDGRIKISPLADWTFAQVEAYVGEHQLPVHPLYAQGYASIGCKPCTRALRAGESGRDGRWWWEHNQKKECGIHISTEGLVRRA